MLASACGFDPREGITTYCAGSGAPRYHSDRPIAGLGDLRPGDHLCVIYRNDDEHRIVLSDYLRRGLEAGERVLYIVDARTARQIRGHLRDAGISVRDAERRGQLLFLSRDDAYMREGVFAPQGMISLLRQETQNALDDGFSGLRVTAEMTWALRGLPGSQRLIEYETLLNEFFPGSPCVGLCQYDARRFPPRHPPRCAAQSPDRRCGNEDLRERLPHPS